MKAIRQVLHYIKGTKDYGITYKHNEGNKIYGFSDSSYRVNTQEGKGTSGIVFYYGESPISSWSIQKQATVVLSSCESKFIAKTAAATQALWLKRLLSKLTHSEEEEVTIKGWEYTIVKQEDSAEHPSEMKILLPSCLPYISRHICFKLVNKFTELGFTYLTNQFYKILMHDYWRRYLTIYIDDEISATRVSKKGVLQVLLDLRFAANILFGGDLAGNEDISKIPKAKAAYRHKQEVQQEKLAIQGHDYPKEMGKKIRRCYMHFLEILTSHFKTAKAPSKAHTGALLEPAFKAEIDNGSLGIHQWKTGEHGANWTRSVVPKGKEVIEHFGVQLEDTTNYPTEPTQGHYMESQHKFYTISSSTKIKEEHASSTSSDGFEVIT
nr:ribonuclease H-like domain, reverse transcriptase, RNA-dependent DNA polymerase [Tanacetum cinerariifolium]